MKIKLLHVAPLEIVVKAIRKCYDSGDKSDSYYRSERIPGLFAYEDPFILGPKDKALIERIINSQHLSTIEHLSFTFEMSGYSRALLQEKSRHRIASVSERSTRYCLGQLKNELPFIKYDQGFEEIDLKRVSDFIVFTGFAEVDRCSARALEGLRACINAGIPNDRAKFCLPDSLTSQCIFTINARSLRNWFELRTNKRAMWEIKEMAHMMYDVIPEDYKFLFEGCIYKEEI